MIVALFNLNLKGRFIRLIPSFPVKAVPSIVLAHVKGLS